MKTHEEVEIQFHIFLTSALDGGDGFTRWPLILRVKIPRYPLDRRLGEPSDAVGMRWFKRKIYYPYQESNCYSSAFQKVAYFTE
jgi:hypothetical protein